MDEIRKDLERLYPTGVDDYFEDAGIQEQMLNVLFVWSKIHPETSYRQGMHELLAPIIYQLREDKYTATGDEGAHANGPLIAEIMDAQHVESDAFWLFSRLMEDME
jgi:TBC1 domain family protein 5